MSHQSLICFSLLSTLSIAGVYGCALDSVAPGSDVCPEMYEMVNGHCEPVAGNDDSGNDDSGNDDSGNDDSGDDSGTDDNDEILDDEPPEDSDITDDSDVELPDAAILVTPLEGITTIQDKQNVTLTIVLSRAPSDVVILPVQTSDSAVATVEPQELTFTADNWNNPQHVAVLGTKESLNELLTPYEIRVGAPQSADGAYSSLKEIRLNATHITATPKPGTTTVNPDSLTLDTATAELLLQGKAVTIKADLDPKASDQVLSWEFENITDDVAYQHLVSVSYGNKNHDITLKSNVVLNSPDCKNKKLDHARELKITAKHSSGKSASAVVALKPYLPSNLTWGDIKKIRDFNTPGYQNKKPDTGAYELGELGCRYYNDKTTQVFVKDMNDKFVEPYIYSVGSSNYGSRASVLGAARFLVTQFPKDIPYASSRLASDDYTVPMTVGRYTMASYNAASDKDTYKAQERIFGLNLTNKAYNSFSSFTDNTVIMGGKNQDTVVPWGCQLKNKKGAEIGANGLRCSGFVSWAMRNGRFYLGDWGSVIFAKASTCLDANKKYQRNFRCKDYVNNVSTPNHKDAANPNNKYESVYEKLSQLNESDFVKISALTETSQFKAGDLLWYGNYKCPKDSSGGCNVGDKDVDNKKCTGGSGHVAMVLGISRNADKTIKYVYVAEATGVNGNRLKAYSISSLKKAWKSKTEASGTQCTYKDTRLIKMDNVYNYYHTKSPDKVKEDLNTYQYTELWF
ncbi:MAG: hypothetical protein J6S69_00735 [Proteobacteria bacterium]|nr:hypothetical protein [Pseudomonadota bacterium]